MVNYYNILKVSPRASGTEIKSAYRRLARKLHPDRNRGAENTALKFAAIAEAYEVLGNPKERVRYDRRLLDAQFRDSVNGDSVFTSTNPHARRWRQMVYEKRYNDIIDRMIAEERSEALAFQKVIYPMVAFYVSAVISAAFKPKIFLETNIIGRLIVVSLFVVGVIHLSGRVREGFERYTHRDDDIHESILDESERSRKPYSRLPAAAVLIGAVLASIAVGLLIGNWMHFAADLFPDKFYGYFDPYAIEFVFYPPIITLFVDLMHTFAMRFDGPRREDELTLR
jgi:hypothetical protein